MVTHGPLQYSCPGLESDEQCPWLRRINAASVREQLAQVPPALDNPQPSTTGPDEGENSKTTDDNNSYPRFFGNYEKFDELNGRTGWVEYPIVDISRNAKAFFPGPARVVWCEVDRGELYLLYHNGTLPIEGGSKYSPFSMGTYRPRQSSSGRP